MGPVFDVLFLHLVASLEAFLVTLSVSSNTRFVLMDIPAKCPGGLLKFYLGYISKYFHRDRLFHRGIMYRIFFQMSGNDRGC